MSCNSRHRAGLKNIALLHLLLSALLLLPISFFLIAGGGSANGQSTSPAPAEKSWEFERFDSDITINEDGSLSVRETLVVNFSGSFTFFNRDLSMQKGDFSEGKTYGAVRYKDIKVSNLEGGTHKDFKVKSDGGVTRVTINFSAADEQMGWIVEYRMTGAVIYGPERDRLYYNAVPVDRDVPVRESRTTVKFPAGTNTGILSYMLYLDPGYPPASSDYGKDGDTLWWEVTGIPPHTTYTIDVEFPKGIVQVPWQYTNWFLYSVIGVSALMFATALVFMIFSWWKKGRDAGRPELDVVTYAPPENLRPAEVGMLINEKPRVQDISATIVDLAVRGKLKIFEEKKSGLLKRTRYGFKRISKDTGDLSDFERKVINSLFETGATVTDEDLKDKFYVHIKNINDLVKNSVMKKDMFIGDPEKVRRKYMYVGLGFALPVPLLLLFLSLRYDAGHFLYLMSGFVTAGLVIWLIGRFMPRRSEKGSEAYSYSMGFKEYMGTAEDAELEYMTPENFQSNLPYAMVLGVTDKWARKFENIYTTPPSWYEGSYTTFSTVYLAGSLNGMVGTMNSTLASSPSSGGGGGFGGGSAGGGFGGGGASAG
ncbi:MAG: DUF2207 domain-containing protein [Actinobacteria bacterium]|nr:DUF2207 domain-containing protein [Actinomycetota bacterium]